MAGNSQRRGAVRKAGSKKGATVGTGGHARKALRGKGPTPKAEDRPNHKAYKAAKAAARAGGRTRPQQRSPQERRAASEIVAGRNAVVEALRAEVPCKTLYVATRIDSDDRVREALKIAADRHVPVLETPRAELDRLTAGAVHQGLAMQMPPYEYAHPGDLLHQEIAGAPLVVALDGITDSRNLGAIVRSAAAFGGHGVLVPERRSAHMSAGAWKTSAGAAARIPVALAGNLNRALEDYKKAGCFVIGLDMDGDVQLPQLDVDRETPLVVVVGSEGKGLSRLVRENCDQIVSVPMSGAMESLNAGIAAAVTLYEIHARRSRLR